jgi:general secretion pathway protein G
MNRHAPPEGAGSGNEKRNRDRKSVYLCLIAGAILIASAYAGVELYRTAVHGSRLMKASSDIRSLQEEITRHFESNGFFPDTLNDISHGDRRDPWGNRYIYLSFAGAAKDKGLSIEETMMDSVGRAKGDLGKVGRAQWLSEASDELPARIADLLRDSGLRIDCDGKILNLDYDLYSMGANGRTHPSICDDDGADDIIRANLGGFIGLAAEY